MATSEDSAASSERKARQREASRRYYAKNRGACLARQAKWRADNPNYQNEWNRRNPDRAKEIRAKAMAKPEMKAWMRQWVRDNPDKIKAAQERYRAHHPGRCREKTRRWTLRNLERVRISSAAAKRKWRAENPDMHRRMRSAWEVANRERLNTYCTNRNRKVRGKLSRGLVDLLMSEQDARCPYCFGDLLAIRFCLDHYMPLARGGRHADDNIQLTCRPCNSRKRDKHPQQFMREIMMLR